MSTTANEHGGSRIAVSLRAHAEKLKTSIDDIEDIEGIEDNY